MKAILILLITIIATNTFSYEDIFNKIESSDCVNASMIAEKEGFESGTYFGTVMLYTASEICDKQTGDLNKSDKFFF